jgi:hypothetical protein
MTLLLNAGDMKGIHNTRGRLSLILLSIIHFACQKAQDPMMADDKVIADETQTENWLAI